MARAAVDKARSLLRKRQFNKAIIILENAREIYRESFDYFLLLGTACLYAGDTGNANRYYQQARHIKLRDINLLLGQAVLYLRRGDTDLAIQYYLDILELEPENKIARSAMEFIRKNGNYETIVRWVDSGKIERFYPPLGPDYREILQIVVSAACGIIIAAGIIHCARSQDSGTTGPRADLTELSLTSEESAAVIEKDLSGGVYRYILSEDEIKRSYDNAKVYFQDYRDNSARVEINKILNSNASSAIKKKADFLITYFEEPDFDTFEKKPLENFDYAQVASDPWLYAGCWVVWSGRITNAVLQDDVYRCDLLVGYEKLEKVDGIVQTYFTPVPQIEGDRPVKILGKIGIENGRLLLTGRAIYQPLRKSE